MVLASAWRSWLQRLAFRQCACAWWRSFVDGRPLCAVRLAVFGGLQARRPEVGPGGRRPPAGRGLCAWPPCAWLSGLLLWRCAPGRGRPRVGADGALEPLPFVGSGLRSLQGLGWALAAFFRPGWGLASSRPLLGPWRAFWWPWAGPLGRPGLLTGPWFGSISPCHNCSQ